MMLNCEGEKMDMTDLTQLPGVGDGTAAKLKEAGILTMMSIAVRTPGQIIEAVGGTEVSARKLINASRDKCRLGFESGIDAEKKQDAFKYIPTYCKSIDKLLGGGLQLGTSMEVFAQFAGGKSQLAHLLAVSTIKSFPDSYVVYIDTENTWKPDRIRHFCKGLGADPEHVLSHIKVGKAVSSDHQMLLVDNIEREIVEGKLDIKLIVIDSLINHFRAEYIARGELAKRQQLINVHLHKLSTLISSYGMAVFLTNQVQQDPGQMFGNPEKFVGGTIIGHFAQVRTWIVKGGKGTRKLKLVDSPNLPEGEAVFKIGATTLESIEEVKQNGKNKI